MLAATEFSIHGAPHMKSPSHFPTSPTSSSSGHAGQAAPDFREVLYCVDDPVATITLNRPDRLNGITDLMSKEMARAFELAEADERVVGIVLTGAGRGFCAGADMDRLQSAASGDGLQESEWTGPLPSPGDPQAGAEFAHGYGWMLAVRKPVIAAINGPAAGLGLVWALLCDLRFAASDAKFTTAFANRGLIAEHGSSWLLPRLIGSAAALDLLWSGRKFSADEALRLGVVNRVTESSVVEEAQDYVRQLAAHSAPKSLMIMKRQVYQHLMKGLGESIQESNELMAESFTRDDFREGVQSFLEKRQPEFCRVAG